MSAEKVIRRFRLHRTQRYDNTRLILPGPIGRIVIKFVGIVIAVAFYSASGARADDGDWGFPPDGTLFLSEVRGVCPSKHLEFVSHYDMYEATSTFRASLPKTLRSRVDRAAGYNPRTEAIRGCHNIVGVTCEDFRMLHGLRRLGLMHRFAQRLCVSYVRCLGIVNCTTAPKAKGSLMSELVVAQPNGEAVLVPHGLPYIPPLPPSNH